jgi:hypothetical protein
MVPALLRLFFGCKHEFGFPVTDPESHRTYQVCVRCGREYEYDWERMTRLRRMPPKLAAPPDSTIRTTHPTHTAHTTYRRTGTR